MFKVRGCRAFYTAYPERRLWLFRNGKMVPKPNAFPNFAAALSGWPVPEDGTDYLEVGYGKGRGDHNSTENLVVYVPVQMFHQLPVGESGVCLQDHKGDLCGRTEYVPAAQASVRQACGFCHTFKRKDRMKLTKLTLIKTLAVFFQNIKFCKTQSRVNFWNILYLCHILLVWVFPPFWPSNLVFGRIPKDTKKPTNSQ